MNIFEQQARHINRRHGVRAVLLIVAAVCMGTALSSGWWTAGLAALAVSEIFRD